jgi:CheY-specific phosphatase CheX
MMSTTMSTTARHPSGPETRALIHQIAACACTKLFDSYGVKLQQVDPSANPTLPVILSGLVGFSGPGIRGASILAASEKPIAKSNPVDGSLADWIAELANQLVGRIKNQLLLRGADLYVTTPIVLPGDHIAPMRRPDITPLVFAADGGSVYVWIELETQPEFVLGTPSEVVSEGEALLF